MRFTATTPIEWWQPSFVLSVSRMGLVRSLPVLLMLPRERWQWLPPRICSLSVVCPCGGSAATIRDVVVPGSDCYPIVPLTCSFYSLAQPVRLPRRSPWHAPPLRLRLAFLKTLNQR